MFASVMACGSSPKAASPEAASPRTASPAQIEAAQPAVAAVKAGDFAHATSLAEAVLADDGDNGYAAAVRALVRFQGSLHELRDESMAVLDSANRNTGFDHARMRTALQRTADALAAVDADLAIVVGDPGFALELCLACWERDWNHSGEVDDNDRRLLQIEIDAQGNELPQSDPRRTPTFRFDIGDVHWARAMVSFQRATLELILAYRWTELDKIIMSVFSGQLSTITIHMDDKARVTRARDLILAGLAHAERSRTAYLAETDDDREWVPNPRQESHPLPLPVDDALYEVWQGVLGDARRLIAGQEALSVAELAQLGDDQWTEPPGGYVHIGKMLAEPKDIVFDVSVLEREIEGADNNKTLAVERILTSILGDYYVKDMKPTPLIGRLARMKHELERGEDTFERKLRYLLWLN